MAGRQVKSLCVLEDNLEQPSSLRNRHDSFLSNVLELHKSFLTRLDPSPRKLVLVGAFHLGMGFSMLQLWRQSRPGVGDKQTSGRITWPIRQQSVRIFLLLFLSLSSSLSVSLPVPSENEGLRHTPATFAIPSFFFPPSFKIRNFHGSFVT